MDGSPRSWPMPFVTAEKYDDLSGAAHWARETLVVHSNDIREHTYSLEDLEKAKTHDDLWNAAQLQMVRGVLDKRDRFRL